MFSPYFIHGTNVLSIISAHMNKRSSQRTVHMCGRGERSLIMEGGWQVAQQDIKCKQIFTPPPPLPRLVKNVWIPQRSSEMF